MMVNSSAREGPFVALLAFLAYAIFVVPAIIIAMLPSALAAILWEARWGWRRLTIDGDAIGAAVAAACLILLALIADSAGPHIVILALPLFMAARALARARISSDRDAAVVPRVVLLLMAAQVVIISVGTFTESGWVQLLVAVPVLLGALAIAMRWEPLRGAAARDALALR